jgi:hypothetical protein
MVEDTLKVAVISQYLIHHVDAPEENFGPGILLDRWSFHLPFGVAEGQPVGELRQRLRLLLRGGN